MRRIAGRAKSRKVTIAETGLPGRPKTSVPPLADAEIGRLAGPQRDAPEDLLDAERGERRPDVVVLADRDAAADDHDVGLERRGDARRGWPRRSSRTCAMLATSAPAASRRAAAACARSSCGPLPGTQRLGGPDQLVAGRERCRRAGGGRRRARRSPRTRRPRARPRQSSVPGSIRRSPGADVLAGAADVGAVGGLDDDLRPRRSPRVGVLDADHGVGAVGHHRAGRDRDRLAGGELAARPGARPATRPTIRRLTGDASAAPAEVRRAHRVAVHRRVVEARHGLLAGVDRLGEHPPEGVASATASRRHRRRPLQDQLPWPARCRSRSRQRGAPETRRA